jgi:hypothetical protein
LLHGGVLYTVYDIYELCLYSYFAPRPSLPPLSSQKKSPMDGYLGKIDGVQTDPQANPMDPFIVLR